MVCGKRDIKKEKKPCIQGNERDTGSMALRWAKSCKLHDVLQLIPAPCVFVCVCVFEAYACAGEAYGDICVRRGGGVWMHMRVHTCELTV